MGDKGSSPCSPGLEDPDVQAVFFCIVFVLGRVR